MKKNFLLVLPIIIYCIFIFLQSAYIPDSALPQFPFSDKLMHIAGYALLGGLVARALIKGNWGINNLKHGRAIIIILAILFSAMYGLSDEIHQAFVATRQSDVFDVIADIAGGAIGVLLFIRCRRP